MARGKRKLTEEEKGECKNDRVILQIDNVVIGKYAYGYNVYNIEISKKNGTDAIRKTLYPANFTRALEIMYERLLQKKLDERPVEDLKNIEKLINIIQLHDEWFEGIADKIIKNGRILEK